MNPYDIKLPKTEDGLRMFYILVNNRLNDIWLEYTTFVESLSNIPHTTLIFPILFSELDFYEILLERTRKRLPDQVVREITDELFFSDW